MAKAKVTRKAGEAFDKRYELRKEFIPGDLGMAMRFVNDTMEMAYASAQQVFGDDPPLEAVLGLYDRMVEEWRREDPQGSRLHAFMK